MKLILFVGIVLVLLFLLFSLGCFLLVCYVPKRKELGQDQYDIPPGEIYKPFRETMVGWIKETRLLPYEDVSVVSFDGLTLRGRYYECSPGAPMELMLHGYRGHSERDMCGGVQRAFALGRNALVVDQRASGRSDGHIITFGIKERFDCVKWIEFINWKFGPGQKIILTGISMGAATVLLTGGMDLPENVIGILADCGYSSAKEIIQKVIRQVKLPVGLLYPAIRFGAKLFGGFDLEETSPVEAVKHCRVPVIFFHGESDDYVPCDMSRINFQACPTPKKLVTVPGAGHGLSYPVDEVRYLQELQSFGVEHWYQL